MKFSKNVIPVGNGRVTDARMIDGVTEFLVSVDGAIIKRTLSEKKKSVKNKIIVSYSDECFILSTGIIERYGNRLNYVP